MMTSPRTIPVLIIITAIIFVSGLVVFARQSAGRIAPGNINGETRSGTMARDGDITGSGANVSPTPNPSSDSNPVTLIAVGDVMTSRTVAERMRRKGADYPFSAVTDFLKTGDIVFGNLETPITPGRVVKPLEMVFRADPESAPALVKAGFTILSLANNHSMNYGAKGMLDTFEFLNNAGLAYVGAGRDEDGANRPVILNMHDMTFAFLAYNDDDVVPAGYEASANRPGTAFMRVEKMTLAVKEAKTKADFVIVSMHSGTEYARLPNTSQKNFAHAAVDAGADLVLGHHPHVVQTLEKYNGKYIFYSLGNFIFDQMQSRDMREGLAVRITFNQTNVSRISLHPVLIEDYAQPRFLEGKEAEVVIKKLGYPIADDPVVE